MLVSDVLHLPPPNATLFPYTTLFRSQRQANGLYTLSGQETHIFSPTVVNTATFGWSKGCGIHNRDRKSTRLNSSHRTISYAVFCLKKKKKRAPRSTPPLHSVHACEPA